MTADFDFSALEENQQARDQIALGNMPDAGLAGFLVAAGDDGRNQAAGQGGAAQKIHDRAADTSGVYDQAGG